MEHYIQHPDGTLTPAEYVSKDGIQTEWALIETAAHAPAIQSRGPQPRKRIPPRDLRPKRNTYQR